MDLAGVATLVRDGKPDQALRTMLRVWTKRRLSRLADAIDVVDRLVEEPWGPLYPEGAQLSQRTRRVAKLDKPPADPRFARALLEDLRAMPFTSNGSRGMWSTVFQALANQRDPRALDALPEIREGWKIRPLQRAWLDEQVQPCLAALEAAYPDGAPVPTAAEAKQLAAIEEALATAVPTGGDARRDALLAEIYADPTDDTPRTVLADHLTIADDPRGEFITLQLLPAPTAAQQKRMSALLARHEREWLGALEPVIAKDGVEFRRGFLAGCRVKLKNAMEAERYGRDPSWATVEYLRFTGTRFVYQPFSAQDSGAFLVDPVMKSLRDVNLHDAEDLALLLRYSWPHLERLASSPEHPLGKAGLAALKSTTKLPALIALEIVAPPKNWLGSTKFGKRLRDVVLGLSSSADERGVVSWLPELTRMPALQTATIHASRLRDTYPRWTFARGADRTFSIATVLTTPESYPYAVATLAMLPPNQLTELAVKTQPRGAKIDAAQRTAMAAAADRQTRLEGFRA